MGGGVLEFEELERGGPQWQILPFPYDSSGLPHESSVENF